jgi:MYXO-CTERM domain-containing protein
MESIWVGLDGVELEATPVDISVYDDVWPWDEYHASFEGLPAESNGGILLAGFGAFESDELPLDLDLDAFHLDRLFRMVGVGYQTYGSVSSFESRIVPAPSGAVVLVVLGGLIRRRRRHSH